MKETTSNRTHTVRVSAIIVRSLCSSFAFHTRCYPKLFNSPSFFPLGGGWRSRWVGGTREGVGAREHERVLARLVERELDAPRGRAGRGEGERGERAEHHGREREERRLRAAPT